MQKIQFYRVSDAYIKFLKQIDNKIQPNYSTHKNQKPYVGVLLTINEHQYFAPLSSYKAKYDKINNNTIVKVYGDTKKKDKLSVIHLNNMFPIIQTEIERMDFSQEDPDYKDLLEKEYSYIISHQEEIRTKAQKLYDDVINGKSFFKKLSCDFKSLEEEYTKFYK